MLIRKKFWKNSQWILKRFANINKLELFFGHSERKTTTLDLAVKKQVECCKCQICQGLQRPSLKFLIEALFFAKIYVAVNSSRRYFDVICLSELLEVFESLSDVYGLELILIF